MLRFFLSINVSAEVLGPAGVLFNDVLSDLDFNPIQDGGAKGPPTSFSPVTSTNVGFGPQNFLTFSFNPFATLVQNCT